MRLSGTEVGFFEDHVDEQALEVGVSGVDETGVRRSFSIQRSTYEPDAQEVLSGMDSYNVSNEQGFTVYGCLRSVRLEATLLTLEFASEDAAILEIPTVVDVDLADSGVDIANLSAKIRDAVDWGAQEKRPRLIGAGWR